jgi:hypothetical protein
MKDLVMARTHNTLGRTKKACNILVENFTARGVVSGGCGKMDMVRCKTGMEKNTMTSFTICSFHVEFLIKARTSPKVCGNG